MHKLKSKPSRLGAPASVDNGWAWIVCFAAHLCLMLTIGYITTLGIFFIEWKEYFDLTATSSSWLVGMPLFVASLLSLFIGVIASRLGVRRVSMVGAVLNGLATILGSFTTDVWQLYLCGALSGLGLVMMVPPSMIMLNQYFKKRYAFANGIVILGNSTGQIIFAPLFRLLIDNYGWRGSMLIVGALQMNGVAACALFRPLKSNTDKVTYSNDNAKQNQNKTFLKYFSFLNILLDLPAMLTLLTASLYSIAWMTNLTHLPARAKEAGWSDDQSSMLLLAYAVISMVTRATHGWFVDRKYISSFKLQLIVLLGAAIVTFLNPISDNYVFLVGYAVILGTFLGIGGPLLIVNIRILVSPSQVPATVSLLLATFFFFNGTGAVIAGKIYDGTGNYIAVFLTAGAILLAAFLLFAVTIVIKTRRDRELRLNTSRNIPCEESQVISMEHV